MPRQSRPRNCDHVARRIASRSPAMAPGDGIGKAARATMGATLGTASTSRTQTRNPVTSDVEERRAYTETARARVKNKDR